MRGSQSFVITQVDGSHFTVFWDDVVEVPLFTQIVVASLDGVTPPNIPAMLNAATGLPAIFTPGVDAQVNANEVSTLVQDIDPNTLAYPVTFSTTVGGSYTSSLTPSLANQQFSVQGSNTVIIPMYISSPQTILTVSGGSVIAALTVPHSTGSQTFLANGGFPSYTWSFQTNASGGSINPTTGAYTAGATPGTDIVKVTDSFGTPNTAIVTITVS